MNTPLISTICNIAVALTMHQAVDKQKLFKMLKLKDVELTEDVFYEAITICRQNLVITGIKGNLIYQTNSSLKRQASIDELLSLVDSEQ
jgi:hypothetical protein